MTETRISTMLKKFKKTMINSSAIEVPDATGLILGGYHVERRLNLQSGEADIYLCTLTDTGNRSETSSKNTSEKSGSKDPGFILKLYRRENAIKPEIVEKLRKVHSPCVAPVLCYGMLENHQYVIMPRYHYPAFSEVLAAGERFTAEDLRDLIIPSVNEGLRAIHEAGILHKDVKPANMIPDDTGEHVVLIDFGISSEAGSGTFVVTSTGMTPFYAAPEAMQGIWHRETDYYALGISVFELFTGYTPFQNEALSPEENARLASISKIEFPEDFPEDLRKLVLGLTYKDLSRRNEPDNPNRRWGYNEVVRWLKGEDLPVPGEESGSGIFRKPYILGESSFSTIPDLVRALLRDPAAGVRELGRGRLTMYFGMTGNSLEKLCQNAERELAKCSEPAGQIDITVRLMYGLCPEIREFYINRHEITGFSDLGKAVLNAAADKDTKFAAAFELLYRGGALRFWAESVLKSRAASTILDRSDKLLHGEAATPEQLLWILGYLFGKNRTLRIGGHVYKNPQEFISEMKKREIRNFASYADSLDSCRDEIRFFSKWIPEEDSRAELARIYRDSERAIFGDRELEIRDASAFLEYLDSLRNSGNAVAIAYLAERYDLALGAVSREVWKEGDPRACLRKAASELVWFDDRLFVSDEALRDFLENTAAAPEGSPVETGRFLDSHLQSLRSLSENKICAETADRLIKMAESRSFVSHNDNDFFWFGEYRFETLKALKNWLEKLLSENAWYPPFFRNFSWFHRDDLEDISGIRGFKTLAGRIRDAGTRRVSPGVITINGKRYPTLPFRKENGYLIFGHYWQDADPNTGKTPIEWRILDQNDHEMLLTSRYALDTRPFDIRDGDHCGYWNRSTDWNECTLRKWLNDEFLKEAFTPEEQEWITVSHFESHCGDSCDDRVFLLSTNEAQTYFRNGEDRKCCPTPYAKAKKPKTHLGISPWFLRSPHPYGVTIVSKGGVLHLGTWCGSREVTVRPALRILKGPKTSE